MIVCIYFIFYGLYFSSGDGIDVKDGVISDMRDNRVIQPLLVSISALSLATECVGMILKIDDLIAVR